MDPGQFCPDDRNHHAMPPMRNRHQSDADPSASLVDGRAVYHPYLPSPHYADGQSPGDSDDNWHCLFQGLSYDPVTSPYDFVTRANSPLLQRWVQQNSLAYVQIEDTSSCPTL